MFIILIRLFEKKVVYLTFHSKFDAHCCGKFANCITLSNNSTVFGRWPSLSSKTHRRCWTFEPSVLLTISIGPSVLVHPYWCIKKNFTEIESCRSSPPLNKELFAKLGLITIRIHIRIILTFGNLFKIDYAIHLQVIITQSFKSKGALKQKKFQFANGVWIPFSVALFGKLLQTGIQWIVSIGYLKFVANHQKVSGSLNVRPNANLLHLLIRWAQCSLINKTSILAVSHFLIS